MKKKSLLCISLLLCLALSACKGKKEGEEKGPPEKGMASVDITVHDLEGKTISLSQLKGKVVVLNFWATWCPPCREEMPSMEALYQKYKENKEFVMLLVSIDENIDTVREFMKTNNYSMPVYHDPNKEAGSAYGITGVPETFLIDKKGVISEKIIGPADWMKPDVIDFINGLLK
ncbi:MAG: TlpA disulfide reductase family protein [Deltaproteobacteria bacterium]|nr:TlpA disulfide reductase family protein [Deltaproteobacteria bacterium]